MESTFDVEKKPRLDAVSRRRLDRNTGFENEVIFKILSARVKFRVDEPFDFVDNYLKVA